MRTFNIAIVDGKTATFTENHTTMDAARDSTLRAALRMLLEEHSYESKRVAECHIEDVADGNEASFNVSLEITDFI